MASIKTEVGIMGFVQSLRDYRFCPPSDNLWTISIKEHRFGKETNQKSLVSLYNNILSVNKSWRKSSFDTKWNVSFPTSLASNVDSQYISLFEEELGVFLAQQVNFQPFENQFDTAVGSQEVGRHGGFLNFGKAFQSRVAPSTCNVSFLTSNWAIGDILIEPWIAAISQRGLIEYSDGALNESQSIRADITINQYSASSPTSETGKMQLRKTIVLYNAFPSKRGQVELKYESGTAGQYVQDIVTFIFDEYAVQYHDTVGNSTATRTVGGKSLREIGKI